MDRLFFSEGALLKLELDELYSALFDNADLYTSIVQLLSDHKSGLTSKEIFQSLPGLTRSQCCVGIQWVLVISVIRHPTSAKAAT